MTRQEKGYKLLDITESVASALECNFARRPRAKYPIPRAQRPAEASEGSRLVRRTPDPATGTLGPLKPKPPV